MILKDEIHLWFTQCDDVSDELRAAYLQLLSPEELAQNARFHFERDRTRHLITRALTRTTLSRYLPIPPQSWSFISDAHGRPGIANTNVEHGHLRFNLSHAGNIVAIGVANERDIGIDVEHVDRRAALFDEASRFFARDEIAALAAVADDQRAARFFDLWTLKEAYIKARGLGLSLPLHHFSFHVLPDRTIEMSASAELQDAPSRWQFWQWQLAPSHVVAICAQATPNGRPALSVKRVLPLCNERTVPVPPDIAIG